MAHQEVSRGFLVECDVPMKQFILHLAQTEPDRVQIVNKLEEDDKHIFVKDMDSVRYIRERITAEAKSLTYTANEELAK